MSKIEEVLNIGANYLDGVSEKLRETDKLLKNGKKVMGYWNPFDDSQRREAKREIERLKKREKWLFVRYLILWIVMIIMTRIVYLAI